MADADADADDQDEVVEITGAYKRILGDFANSLDNAACVAMVVKMPRERFIEMAGLAFDFIKRWHDAAEEWQDDQD